MLLHFVTLPQAPGQPAPEVLNGKKLKSEVYVGPTGPPSRAGGTPPIIGTSES